MSEGLAICNMHVIYGIKDDAKQNQHPYPVRTMNYDMLPTRENCSSTSSKPRYLRDMLAYKY